MTLKKLLTSFPSRQCDCLDGDDDDDSGDGDNNDDDLGGGCGAVNMMVRWSWENDDDAKWWRW